MSEFPPAEVLAPNLSDTMFDPGFWSREFGSRTIATIRAIAQQALGSVSGAALQAFGAGEGPVVVSRSEFVLFVGSFLERVRTRAMAPNSLYAIRVRDPPWFSVLPSELIGPVVAGTEVGSLLGEDLVLADTAEVTRSLVVLAERARDLEVTLGHVAGARRVLRLRLSDP